MCAKRIVTSSTNYFMRLLLTLFSNISQSINVTIHPSCPIYKPLSIVLLRHLFLRSTNTPFPATTHQQRSLSIPLLEKLRCLNYIFHTRYVSLRTITYWKSSLLHSPTASSWRYCSVCIAKPELHNDLPIPTNHQCCPTNTWTWTREATSIQPNGHRHYRWHQVGKLRRGTTSTLSRSLSSHATHVRPQNTNIFIAHHPVDAPSTSILAYLIISGCILNRCRSIMYASTQVYTP